MRYEIHIGKILEKRNSAIKTLSKSPDYLIISAIDYRRISAMSLKKLPPITEIYGMKVIISHDLEEGELNCGFDTNQ